MESLPFKKKGATFHTSGFQIIWILEIIKILLGDGHSLKQAIQTCIDLKIEEQISATTPDLTNVIKLSWIFPIFYLESNHTVDGWYIYHSPHRQIKYNLVRPEQTGRFFIASRIKDNSDAPLSGDIFPFLLEAVKILQRINLLK